MALYNFITTIITIITIRPIIKNIISFIIKSLFYAKQKHIRNISIETELIHVSGQSDGE